MLSPFAKAFREMSLQSLARLALRLLAMALSTQPLEIGFAVVVPGDDVVALITLVHTARCVARPLSCGCLRGTLAASPGTTSHTLSQTPPMRGQPIAAGAALPCTACHSSTSSGQSENEAMRNPGCLNEGSPQTGATPQ